MFVDICLIFHPIRIENNSILKILLLILLTILLISTFKFESYYYEESTIKLDFINE